MIDRLRRVLAPGLLAAALTTVVAQSATETLDYALDTPRATVDSLHAGLVELSSSEEDSVDVTRRFERLEPLIRATHDLRYIAELTLRRQWRDMAPAERERFVEAFRRLSAMTYAARFGNVTAETFELTKTAEAGGGRVQVSALILREDDADIPLEYVLHERDGAWRIVNIVADGVSDLALKRAEYQRVLEEGGVGDLVEHLEAQTAELVASP